MMRKLTPALALALAACAGKPLPAPAPAVVVEYRDRLVEVQRPCPAQRPTRPTPLARPLPRTPAQLVDLLTAKLTEWAGAGGYGDRADAAIKTCTEETGHG